ncbi:V-set and immunoglobulin domain-containing protein 4 [Candoia aspera]|uniref:V-set and immunoglobulin domain-containing protein 4 n=1 Tax=Candoia aspera TaxID=51853 RepID=UPI002FD7C18E
MERWAQLWILGFVTIVPGKAVLDLTGTDMADGTWRAPVTLLCMYEPSADFKELQVTWKFFVQHEGPRSIFLRDSSGDHTFLVAFRGRISVAEKPPGDVSLHIKELEMTDTGVYTCSVRWEAKNMSRITKEKTIQLKVVKVTASKPVIKSSSLESVLPNGTRISLTCSASGSPPIRYHWYKERPGREAEHLQMGAVLAFDSLQVSDSARYFCTAENRLSVQREQSDSFPLTVTDASEFSTAGPDTESGEHPTETATSIWRFKTQTAAASRRPQGTHIMRDGVVTSSTPFGNSLGQQNKIPGHQRKVLPLYIIILIAVLCAALVLVVVSVVLCRRRRPKSDNVYEVTYNNNANEDLPASPGVNGTCVYEEPNSAFGNPYTMEPTKAAEYVIMGEKMVNEYEILEKKLGN